MQRMLFGSRSLNACVNNEVKKKLKILINNEITKPLIQCN